MLTKLREVREEHSDKYFLEVVGDKAITDDDYVGLQVMSSSLDLLSTIPLPQGLLIYSAFVGSTREELVLYDADNDRMVYVDIGAGTHRILELGDEVAGGVFSQMYHWSDGSLVVYRYDGQFYELCVLDGQIAKLDRARVARDHPLYYEFCEEAQRSGRREVYANDYQFVTLDEDRRLVCLHDVLHQRVYTAPMAGLFPHEVIFREGTFVLVDEKQVTVCDEGGVMATLLAPGPCRFLRVRFLGTACCKRIVVLSNDYSDVRRSSLALYELDAHGAAPLA